MDSDFSQTMCVCLDHHHGQRIIVLDQVWVTFLQLRRDSFT